MYIHNNVVLTIDTLVNEKAFWYWWWRMAMTSGNITLIHSLIINDFVLITQFGTTACSRTVGRDDKEGKHSPWPHSAYTLQTEKMHIAWVNKVTSNTCKSCGKARPWRQKVIGQNNSQSCWSTREESAHQGHPAPCKDHWSSNTENTVATWNVPTEDIWWPGEESAHQ